MRSGAIRCAIAPYGPCRWPMISLLSGPSQRPEEIQKVPLPDGQTVVPGIDAIQEGLIGRVVVEWSRLEGMLDDMIWALTGVSFEDFGRPDDRLRRMIQYSRTVAMESRS